MLSKHTMYLVIPMITIWFTLLLAAVFFYLGTVTTSEEVTFSNSTLKRLSKSALILTGGLLWALSVHSVVKLI